MNSDTNAVFANVLKARCWLRRAVITILLTALSCAVIYATRDRRLMWETTRVAGAQVSTPRALEAAKRFFDSTELREKTRDEIIAIAGHPTRSSDSMYNQPFYPVKAGVMCYRFDVGAYGWQFEISFSADGRATRVESRQIVW